jgi:hypothetical protein
VTYFQFFFLLLSGFRFGFSAVAIVFSLPFGATAIVLRIEVCWPCPPLTRIVVDHSPLIITVNFEGVGRPAEKGDALISAERVGSLFDEYPTLGLSDFAPFPD